MVRVNSTMLPLGTPAPDFSLPDPEGKIWSLSDFQGAPALLVAFICNHCPFVVHLQDKFAEVANAYRAKGVAVVAISANDVENYPDDTPEKMGERARQLGFTFPYLYDETQETAKTYRAACTPDFYVFDKNHKLVYRGQFDDSRPESGAPVTGADLSRALDAALEGRVIPEEEQKPSLGCNIKWKAGNAPAYFAA